MIEEILMYFFNKVMYILNEYKNLNMAYKLVLLLYFFINCFTLSAQTTDSVIMSIVYTSEYNYSKYRKSDRCDMMRLDIGKRSSHFFSDYFEQKLAKMDSMNMSGSISIMRLEKETRALEVGQTYGIYKNFPSDGRLTYTEDILDNRFVCEEDMPQINWSIVEGDTVICGYRCLMAEGELRRRKWNVWFAPEIAVSDGPWKLCVLPGLILQAVDTENIFSFRCVGIEKSEGKALKMVNRKYERCTPEKLYTIITKFLSDPLTYMRDIYGLTIPQEVINQFVPEANAKAKLHFLEYYDKE